jgi:hypothetical protein
MSSLSRTTPAALLFALLAAAACSRSDREGRTGDAPADAPEPEIVSVQVGRQVDSAQRVTDPTETFAPDDTLWASVETRDTPAGATIAVRWLYTEGGDEQLVAEDSHTTSAAGSGFTSFHATNADPWPAGSYQVRVRVNGGKEQTKAFRVSG